MTGSAAKSAEDSVRTFFTDCAARTAAAPDNCPQRVNDFQASNVHWSLVGDPSAGIRFESARQGQGQGLQVVAVGHWLMTVAYDGTYPDGTRHRYDGGAYALALTWDGQKFGAAQSGGFAADPKPLIRPAAATDDVVKAAVAQAFQACAKVTSSGGSPDCPQSHFAYMATNSAWSLNGDPLAGATVGFDEQTGILTVDGSYSMTFSYDSPFSGHQTDVQQGNYKAYVLWDGQKPECLYISAR